MLLSLLLAGCSWTHPTAGTMQRLDDWKACDDWALERLNEQGRREFQDRYGYDPAGVVDPATIYGPHRPGPGWAAGTVALDVAISVAIVEQEIARSPLFNQCMREPGYTRQ
jgi:hypothetical protein